MDFYKLDRFPLHLNHLESGGGGEIPGGGGFRAGECPLAPALAFHGAADAGLNKPYALYPTPYTLHPTP